MMKKYWKLGAIAMLSLAIVTGCNSNSDSSKSSDTKTTDSSSSGSEKEATTQKITYLGKEYTVPSKVDNIVTASLEAMEDAAALGVKPTGVVSIAGNEIPEYLEDDLKGATVVGTKFEPSAEAMLKLKPDVILGTDKWDAKNLAKYNKVAPTFPYTFISEKWRENLRLFGELTNKQDEAEKIISDYEAKAAELKEKAAKDLKGQKVLVIRIRGTMAAYGPSLYLNPILYDDLGLEVPKEIADAKTQIELSYETLAKINPDVIFLQFDKAENAKTPKALDEVLNNSIFKSVNAAKNDKVFVNSISPSAQGGTAWSKTRFLDVVAEKLLK
ncbi:ABC transporter substrate-binding protein [Rummeliibacillus suwonensis]|uniref:ABC transporter substrate-binding protein n=1 Tax=Rummeliibacillus suwonensis TaxID=1306154 RepID=UPI0035E3C8C0